MCFKQKKHLGAVFITLRPLMTLCRVATFLQNFLGTASVTAWAILSRTFYLRCFKVRVGSHFSSRFTQENGVPQGSVLSVALFAVMINDIGDDLPISVGKSLFVDDFAIWFSAASARLVSRQLQPSGA